MKFIYTGKNKVVSEEIKERISKKVGKLQKFFNEETEAFVVLSFQRTLQKVEVTIPFNGVVFRSETADADIFAAIDKTVDVLERQIRKNKTRLEKHLREGSFHFEDAHSEVVEEEPAYQIIKNKRFDIKPMDLQEAILQMNMLGHKFFVFANEHNKINVVYKRDDGNYGVIQPEG